MRHKLLRFLERLPSPGLSVWLATFTAVVAVRVLLQWLVSPATAGIPDILELTEDFIFMYLISGLAIILWLHYISKISLNLLARGLLMFLPVIWLPPIFSWFTRTDKNMQMSYLLTGSKKFLFYWLTLGGPRSVDMGVTLGQRAEVVLICVVIFAALYALSRNFWKALVGGLGAYTIIFVQAIMPSILILSLTIGKAGAAKIASTSNYDGLALILTSLLAASAPLSNIALQFSGGAIQQAVNSLSPLALYQLFWLVGAAVLIIYFSAWDKKVFFAITKNLKIERLVNYWLAIVGGILLAAYFAPNALAPTRADFLPLLALLGVYLYAHTFSILDNDLADQGIDKISSPDRPLINGNVPPQTYRRLKTLAAVWSLIGAYLLGQSTLLLASTAMAIAYLYSNPPMRLKRWPFVANLCIGLALLCAVLSGFLLWTGQPNFQALPLDISAAIIVSVAIITLTKDLKDIEGDRADGVYTIANVLGTNRKKTIYSLIALLIIILSYYFHTSAFILALIPGALYIGVKKLLKDRIGYPELCWANAIYTSALFVFLSR